MFNEYVKKNIRVPQDEQGIDFKGIMILSFETNKKDTPNKIKVVQPLCAECEEEAIRLLIQGP